MDLTKKELAERLTEISSRYDDVCAIREKIDKIVPEDTYERTVVLPDFPEKEDVSIDTSEFISLTDHENLDSAKKAVLAMYEKANEPPKKPSEPEKKKFVAPPLPGSISGLRFLGGFAIFISIFLLLSRITSSFSSSTEWTIPIIYTSCAVSLLIGIGCFIGAFVLKTIAVAKEQDLRAKHERSHEELDIRYSEELKKHELELNEYKKGEQEFFNKYLKWRECYLLSLEEEKTIKAKLERDKEALKKELEKSELVPALNRLNEINDIIAEEYLPSVSKIELLVRSGRADTLKEAINLYEELLYKERQLELQREVEKQRQLEAQLRRLDEERRHNEEMQFLEEQEYQRQQAERYRIEQEEKRYREEATRREEAERQRQAEERRANARRKHEEATKIYTEHRNMHRQCNSCIHNGSCTMAYRRPNCASYRPK